MCRLKRLAIAPLQLPQAAWSGRSTIARSIVALAVALGGVGALLGGLAAFGAFSSESENGVARFEGLYALKDLVTYTGAEFDLTSSFLEIDAEGGVDLGFEIAPGHTLFCEGRIALSTHTIEFTRYTASNKTAGELVIGLCGLAPNSGPIASFSLSLDGDLLEMRNLFMTSVWTR